MTKIQTIKSGEHLHLVGQANTEQHFVLEDEAVLDFFLPILDDQNSDSRVTVELKGKRSRVNSHIVFFGHGAQEQKIHFEHVHSGEETESSMSAKGAAKDKAISSFFGGVKMLPGSINAKGHLSEHNLILSPHARITAVPALEIEHNEVEASHAATLERVDEEKMFYLNARGLPQAEAMELLVEGFFEDAFSSLEDEELRRTLTAELFKKLS